MHLTATDMTRALNLAPPSWGNAVSVYREKAFTDPNDLPPDEPAKWMKPGTYMEPGLILYVADRLKVKVYRSNAFRVDPEESILSATLDGYLHGTKGQLVEAKAVSGDHVAEWGDDLSDDVPSYVYVQVQVQMACTGFTGAWIPVQFAQWTFENRLYFVGRDDEMIAALRARAREFWDYYIVPRRCPDPDRNYPEFEVIKRRKREPGKLIELPQSLAERYAIAKQELKDAEEAEKESKAFFLDAWGDAEGARFGGQYWTYLEQSRRTFDLERFTAEHPQLAAEYMKQGKPYRVLRRRKNPPALPAK